MEQTEAMRVSFDNYANGRSYNIEWCGNGYCSADTQKLWTCWQAALASQGVPDRLRQSAGALIAFQQGPWQSKRPDVFQRLIQRLANALDAAAPATPEEK